MPYFFSFFFIRHPLIPRSYQACVIKLKSGEINEASVKRIKFHLSANYDMPERKFLPLQREEQRHIGTRADLRPFKALFTRGRCVLIIPSRLKLVPVMGGGKVMRHK